MDTKVLSSGFKYENLPESYVRPESERPCLSEVSECQNRAQTVQQVGDACKSYGFFQVINHGVSTEAVEKMLGTATEFFSLPVEEKMKLYSDDPSKTMRLSTSFNVNKEKVHNWRDYLRLHCHHFVIYYMAIRTQCVQYLPTNLKVIIVGDGATTAGWIIKLVDCKIIIKLDSGNDKPDGSCADRVVPHGGVILFDETAKPDFIQTCYDLLFREYGNIPFVLCSNKEISADNNHNLEAPFLYLAKKLTVNDEPQPSVLIPPHNQMDMTAAQHKHESGPAAAQPFPVEDNNGCCIACLKPLVLCLKACYYMVSFADACMNCVEEA